MTTTSRHDYPAYIAGKPVDTADRVCGLNVHALLGTDGDRSLARGLLRGDPAILADHPHVLGSCAVVDEALHERALHAAAGARKQWRAVPLEDRLAIAARFRERVLDNRDEFMSLLTAEGTPRLLAEWQLAGILDSVSEQNLAWYSEQLRQEYQHGSRRLLLRRQPDGVVCVDPPHNAPAPCGALAGLAALAGNCVVIRVPRSAPVSLSYLLHRLLLPELESFAPPGVVNVVCGDQEPLMRQWLNSGWVDDIMYFGTTRRGRWLERECVEQRKKPILELSGNDGVVVWHDAHLEHAAEAIAEAFYGSGQICMAPNYVVAHPNIAEALLERVCTHARRQRPGAPEDDRTTLSPVIHRHGYFAHLDQARTEGATVLCGGGHLAMDGTPADSGLFLQPAVLRVDGLHRARRVSAVRQETFFPLLPVIVPEPQREQSLLDGIIDLVNDNDYGLRNSLWAGDTAVIEYFLTQVTNGGLLKINDSHLGFRPYLPTHGGTGLSGGVHGEANYPMLRTTHLQGVGFGNGEHPAEARRSGLLEVLLDE